MALAKRHDLEFDMSKQDRLEGPVHQVCSTHTEDLVLFIYPRVYTRRAILITASEQVEWGKDASACHVQ